MTPGVCGEKQGYLAVPVSPARAALTRMRLLAVEPPATPIWHVDRMPEQPHHGGLSLPEVLS
jgi:hypothetical protein